MINPGEDWRRLDPRMLLVYPVRELVRFLPALIAIFVAGTAAGRTDWWHGVGVAIPMGLGVLRYFTTFYRVTPVRIELRRGLLNRRLTSTPRDRVRTVDVTASLTHRVLGVVSVRIGTGSASEDDLDLDGLTRPQADLLRRELLGLAEHDPAAVEPQRPDRVVLLFDPRWARFAPLTATGLALAAGAVGLASQTLNTTGGWERFDPEGAVQNGSDASVWLIVPLSAVLALVVISGLAVVGYLVTNWDFRLAHTGPVRRGAWHLRRGLLTTRETTVDDERVSGVDVSEPLGLRLAKGGRVSAIVTGLDRGDSGSALLAPPCPRAVLQQVGGEVLGTAEPLTAPLVRHGSRATQRRWTRALAPSLVLVVGVALAVVLADLPAPWLGPALLAPPIAALLARDRARALGHTLVAGHLVARSGSLGRHREALAVRGIIGWNLRASWFQRRAGLTTLVATTAGGDQAVSVLDVPEELAVALAHDAQPGLLEQFLA